MKVIELREEARALAIKGYYKMKKQELIEALDKYYNISHLKKNYKIKLTSNNSTLEIPINNCSELREAMAELIRVKYSNIKHGYAQIELFEDNKLKWREKC